jgi:hypothetical protein
MKPARRVKAIGSPHRLHLIVRFAPSLAIRPYLRVPALDCHAIFELRFPGPIVRHTVLLVTSVAAGSESWCWGRFAPGTRPAHPERASRFRRPGLAEVRKTRAGRTSFDAMVATALQRSHRPFRAPAAFTPRAWLWGPVVPGVCRRPPWMPRPLRQAAPGREAGGGRRRCPTRSGLDPVGNLWTIAATRWMTRHLPQAGRQPGCGPRPARSPSPGCCISTPTT